MRSALVTGGSGAVGSAVVRRLRGLGVPTWFTWRRSSEVALELEAIGAVGVQVDLREPSAIRAAVADLRIDAWVHAAGVRSDARLADLGDEARRDALAVHADAPMVLLQALVPRMAAGGDIVVVGGLDRGQSAPLPLHVAAGHGAASALVMAAAHELGPLNIRINLVAIGLLTAGMGDDVDKATREAYRKFSSLRREGTPDDVARTITWLLLENRYMTGKVLAANGGL